MANQNNLTRISCKGLNLTTLINTCTNNNIYIENLDRLDGQTIEFSVTDKDLKKLKLLDLKNYDIKIIKNGGKKKLLNLIYMRMGLIIGMFLSIILLLLLNNRLFNVKIFGLEKKSEVEIIKAIEDYGIKKFDIMNFSTVELENYLSDKFNFSFVSLIKKGNTLIINVKEELPQITENYNPIIAEYNMILTKINVFAGTTNKKIGDIVYKGDVLVEPYEIISDEKFEVEACAEIEGDIFFSENYVFKSEEEVLVRTGKSKVINSSFSLGKIKLWDKSYKNNFKNFEIVPQNTLVSNYFLPLQINKSIAYELEVKKITKDFEKEKDEIIENLKVKAYSKVPSHLTVESEEVVINSTNYGNIVTIYLKSSVYLKYGNND